MIHKNLKIFKFFDVEFRNHIDNDSDNFLAVCPFCGSISSKHGVKPSFYVNVNDKKWDCKICGKDGGYQKFIQYIYESSQKQTTDLDLLKLSIKKKGVQLKTLKHFGVTKYNDNFLIPVWDQNKEKLLNLRKYNSKTNVSYNCPGNVNSLYNLWSIPHNYEKIILAEGEPDSWIAHQIIKDLDLKNTIVLGVPGATQFKMDWCHFFNGKYVDVLYDNDYEKIKNGVLVKGAGKLGQRKVQKMLSAARLVQYVNWEDDRKDGFDLRDLYLSFNRNSEKTVTHYTTLLKTTPMPIKAPEGYEGDIEEDKPDKPLFEYTGEGLQYELAYKGFEKWLYLNDLDPRRAQWLRSDQPRRPRQCTQ